MALLVTLTQSAWVLNREGDFLAARLFVLRREAGHAALAREQKSWCCQKEKGYKETNIGKSGDRESSIVVGMGKRGVITCLNKISPPLPKSNVL